MLEARWSGIFAFRARIEVAVGSLSMDLLIVVAVVYYQW